MYIMDMYNRFLGVLGRHASRFVLYNVALSQCGAPTAADDVWGNPLGDPVGSTVMILIK